MKQNAASHSQDTLFAHLARGGLVLTPNHRVAVALLDACGQHRRQQAESLVCPSPAVHPVDIWVARQWQDYGCVADHEVPDILAPHHEFMLWLHAIRNVGSGANLLNQRATASAARQAWSTLLQWRIPLESLRRHPETRRSADTRAFLEWHAQYAQVCAGAGLVSLSEVIELTIDALDSGKLKPPPSVLLCGFSQPPPLYQALFDSLESAGCHLRHWQAPRQRIARVSKCRAPTTDAELQAAAAWAAAILERQADARIAVICPALSRQRNAIAHIFSHVLGSETTPRFSISGSESLDLQPAIATALGILDLNQETLPLLEFCQLLRSPFIAAADTEADARGFLELELRRPGVNLVRLADVRRLAAQEGRAWCCPRLAQGLMEVENLRLRHKGRQHWQVWVDFIDRQLSAMGWPGESMDAAMSRTLKDWQQLLVACQGLPPLLPAPDLPRMRTQLRWLAAQLPCTPWPRQAAVSVMTPLEAENLPFTHAWILGLDESQWPPEQRASSFIPLSLQRSHGIPEADTGNQVKHGRRMLQGILSDVAEEVVLSHATMLDDMPVKASSLYTQVAAGTPLDLSATDSRLGAVYQRLRQAADTTLFEEVAILPWREAEAAGGGHSLLGDQAACPFRSLARHRLRSEVLQAPATGLPATASGNILHHALESLWRRLGDSAMLQSMGSDQLDKLTREVVESALNAQLKHYPLLLQGRFRDLEMERLVELLLQWLRTQETQRGPFQVEAEEVRVTWQHDNLRLTLRIDRMDRLPDGSLVVIDYKSSPAKAAPAMAQWRDERPDQVQLQLYQQALAQAAKGTVSGLLYAHVHPAEMAYKGLIHDPAIHPGIALDKGLEPDPDSWRELQEGWRVHLAALAEECLAGVAPVSPKRSSTCQFCHLHGLCRIGEVAR